MFTFFKRISVWIVLVGSVHVGLCKMSRADLAVLVGQQGKTVLLYQLNDRIVFSECKDYADLGLTIETARLQCQNIKGTLYVDFFRSEASKVDLNLFFNAHSIIGEDKVLELESEVNTLEEQRNRYGDSSIDVDHLIKLKQIIQQHKDALNEQESFFEKQNAFFEGISSHALTVALPGSFSETYFKAFKIPFKKYEQIDCGSKGTLKERVEDCSKYNNSSTSDYKLLTRIVRGWPALPEIRVSNVWVHTLTGVFVFEGDLPSNDFMKDFTGHLWRQPEGFERSILNVNFSRDEKIYISKAPLNLENVAPYGGSIRSGKSKIVYAYADGVMTFELYESAKRTLLKEVSIARNPRSFAGFPTDSDDHRVFSSTRRHLESFSDFNDYLIEKMEMAYIGLFPITIAANLLYAIPLAGTLPYDAIFNVRDLDRVAYRKFMRMILGHNLRVGPRVFRQIISELKKQGT